MFTTYSASAGSGKTTNLVADYITRCFLWDKVHISDSDRTFHLDNYQKILAITFTNNAAAEMKARIVQTLHDFAFLSKTALGGRSSAIYDIVVKNLFENNTLEPNTIEDFMRVESRELLRRILFDYARFTISTIDSFFQRVIRSSALSLNLNLNYSVQIDMDEFYLQAIDQLLNELSADTDLSKRIIMLLDNSLEDSGKLDIDGELKSALKILYDNAEKNHDFLKILQNSTHDDILRFNQKLRKHIKEIPEQLAKDIERPARRGKELIEELQINFHYPTLKTWFDKVLADPINNYRESIEEFKNSEGSYYKKKTLSADEEERHERLMPQIEKCFNEIAQIQKKPRKLYLDCLIQNKNADKIMMLSDLKAKMEDIKLQNNFFILNESNTLIYETIQDKGFEFVFDRTKYENFFIDEFQDTSKMQWEDLKPILINNALANGKDVILFGDVKQAIYRFRNGDADLFYRLIDYARLQEEKELPQVIDQRDYQTKNLGFNYRSLQSIVEFNNDFFEFYSTQIGLTKYYAQGLKQKVSKKASGLVQVFISQRGDLKDFRRKRNKPDDDFIQRILENEDISVQDMEVLCAIQDARMRGYHDGDIAILFAGNDKCSHMADLLLKQGWNVISEKSLSLSSSTEVNLIIHTLHYLLRPNDILSQSVILHHLSKSSKGTDLQNQSLLFKLKGRHDFDEILLNEFDRRIPIETWRNQPLFVVIKEIIRFYGLDKEQNPFVIDFEDFVLDYLQGRNGEIATFLTWWNQLEDSNKVPSLALPSGQDAICISTIHKSKGLEYPVVIVPYNSGGNRSRPLWDKIDDTHVAYIELSKSNCVGSSYEELYETESLNNEMDTLNQLYVAHTRASEMLYIVTQKTKTDSTSYGSLLHKFIQTKIESSFTQDEDDERFFYAGDISWCKKSKEEEKANGFIPKMTTSDFRMESLDTQKSDKINKEAVEEGNFVHDYLSKLTCFPQNQDEIEKLLNDMESEKRDRLRDAFKHILDDTSLNACFTPNAKTLNESTILDTDGNAYRPDRIVFMDDRVMVIDYKTGQPYPKYQEQIDQYCALLRKMGYANVEGRLLYV